MTRFFGFLFITVVISLLSACGANTTAPEAEQPEADLTVQHHCPVIKFGRRDGDSPNNVNLVSGLQDRVYKALRTRVNDRAAANALLRSSFRNGKWDGAFGWGTYHAVVRFQRWAFPGQPSEWDGIVGDKTWNALHVTCGHDGN